MGDFISAEEVKTLARVPELKAMEPEDLEEIYVATAERAIEEVLNLDLNTDGRPRHWEGRMQSPTDGPRLTLEYQTDYRRAAFLTIEHMAQNPQNLRSESVGGASWSPAVLAIPPGARVLMRRWSRPGRIGRA